MLGFWDSVSHCRQENADGQLPQVLCLVTGHRAALRAGCEEQDNPTDATNIISPPLVPWEMKVLPPSALHGAIEMFISAFTRGVDYLHLQDAEQEHSNAQGSL